jgi:hypothetical protein
MSVITSLIKGLGKFVLTLGVVGGLGYLVLLAVNWQDEAPSAQALALQQQFGSEPVGPNDYLRYQGQAAALQSHGHTALQQLFAGCNQAGCQALAAADTAQLEQLLLQNTTLLAFYQQLLDSNHWQEPMITSADELPAFQPLLNGQRLYLLQIYLLAQQGHWPQVEQQLAADLSFWRSLLTENSYLLTKMISRAAIERHFNLALQLASLSKATEAQLNITLWQLPFTEAELSLTRALAGEWQLAELGITASLHDTADLNLLEKLALTLVRPLYQPQASRNELAVLLNCPQTETVAALSWYQWFYNPLGKIINRAAMPPCADYLNRLAQLEQQRQRLQARL